MEIHFTGKFKSINSFAWKEIPDFVILIGPNGAGKSQLLELIYNTIVNKRGTIGRVSIIGKTFLPDEVTYLKSEWSLKDTHYINLSTIQQKLDQYYDSFMTGSRELNQNLDGQVRPSMAFQKIRSKTTEKSSISRKEFYDLFNEMYIEDEPMLGQKIGEVFYNYRLSEIELEAQKITEENIKIRIGEKPWIILREIIRESKLPFDINDPSKNGIKDGFHLKLTHQIFNEEVNFNDLSSGEKVLIGLVFHLYNSQEKGAFPRLLLLDEPDAHLHPSMSKQLLNVVKNVLVDKFKIQVIMTTHSPSTIVLAPNDSIYEMSMNEPRIQKSPSKNHSVSLLTAGLVFVGEGTKYFLVEDKDDAKFYSSVYTQLTTENKIDSTIPIVFIPASTNSNSGGKDVVINWVEKLQNSGLENIINGLIDLDNGNTASSGVFKIGRYSIENYLADPILVYAALMDKEKERNLDLKNLKLSIGEEYKLKSLATEDLQKIADAIIKRSEVHLEKHFTDFDMQSETEKVEVKFIGGHKLLYPKWILNRRGKTILNQVYNDTFGSSCINFKTLLKAFRKVNMFPSDLVNKFVEIKG